jgi:hypothetical protein
MSKLTPVEESDIGLYVWKMPDGRFIGDEDGNFLNVPSRKNDLKQMAVLRSAVKYYGIEEGEPVFLAGRRRVSDEEFTEQEERLKAGLTPDPFDIPALMDEIRAKKEHGSYDD